MIYGKFIGVNVLEVRFCAPDVQEGPAKDVDTKQTYIFPFINTQVTTPGDIYRVIYTTNIL